MKIVRFGGLGASSFRIIDFLDDDKVDELYYVNLNNSENLKYLYNAFDFFNAKYLYKKFTVIDISVNINLYRVLRMLKFKKLAYYLCGFNKYTKIFLASDFFWVGDNDFDGSNYFVPLLKSIFPEKLIVKYYKETRYKFVRFEYESLVCSDCLVFPHRGYIDFFRKKYNGLDLSSKSKYKDLDLRYSKLINYVKSLNVTRLFCIRWVSPCMYFDRCGLLGER